MAARRTLLARPSLSLPGGALLAVLLLPAEAWSRAGGGQGYHGGGSHSGGSHIGGGSGGGGDMGPLLEILYWSLRFCFYTHPLIGIPLIALAIYLFYKLSQQGADSYRGAVIRRAGGMAAEQRHAAGIAHLQASDPAFDEEAFCHRAADACRKLQAAWSAQQLDPLRPYVSDGIFERFTLQIAEQRDFGYRNQLDNFEIGEVQLVQVAGDALFDLLTIAIRARADDYRVALATGKRLSDGGTPQEFVEYWTFLRRQGVATSDKPGLIEGHCPNCGADIVLNQSARCPACDSLVRSGNYDWVLTEITQAGEWNDDQPAEPAGVAEYRVSRDPGFEVQHLEDRASVLFWRKAMADRLGNTRPLEKMALPEFCEAYPQRWGSTPGLRRYWGDTAVGSVDTLGVIAGQTTDRALVEVRWAGRLFVARSGRQPEPGGENALFRTLYLLERQSGVRSDVDTSVTSAHCPQCGAPPGDLAAHACEFCGAVLNDGTRDWVLSALYAIPSDEADALVEELSQQTSEQPAPVEAEVVPELPLATDGRSYSSDGASAPHGNEVLAWAIQMALADQELSDKEQRALERAAGKRGVPPERLRQMIGAAQQGQLEVPQPQGAEEGRKWMAVMADMALVDGRIEPAEGQLLLQAAAQLGWSRADVKLLLADRKTRLYRAARQQIKDLKQGPEDGAG